MESEKFFKKGMMKLVKLLKIIVNDKRKLIGFVVEATDRELGGFSDMKVQKPIPLRLMAESGFQNNQITVTPNGGIIEAPNFKINELGMVMYTNNQFVDIPNTMSLIKKYTKEGEVIGFRIRFGDGYEDNFTYENVVRLSFWFKPENFIVRRLPSGKYAIAGKPGVLKLEDLPQEEIGKPSQAKARAKAVEVRQDVVDFINNADIVGIYDLLKAYNGLVIKLPDEEYIAQSNVAPGEGFIPLGLGEYAYPDLSFHETHLNVNTLFRKPGIVYVEIDENNRIPIHTYTYSRKSIFLNGENYIRKFGIALPEQYSNMLIDAFGKSMSVQKLDDKRLEQAMKSLTGRKDLVFYLVDTNKVDLISRNKLNSYILSVKELYDLVDSMFIPRLISKYTSPSWGILSELKKKATRDRDEILGKKPIGMFAGMNEQYLQKVREAGIDIYDGSYRTLIKVDSPKKGKEEFISIDYAIRGQEMKRWTYKVIREKGLANSSDLPSEVVKVINRLENINDLEEKIRKAYEVYYKAEHKVEELKRRLWLHKCAMYLAGNKERVHQHDKELWQLDTNRKAKAEIYNCVEPSCAGLMLALVGVTI